MAFSPSRFWSALTRLPNSGAEVGIPKQIWMLWLQGWSKAPPLVHACVETWRKKNPGWKLHLLTAESLGQFLELDRLHPGLGEKALPPEALSDVVRIELLRAYGGVWVDSTVYCNVPLDRWVEPNLPRGFFAFSRPGPDRMVSSWFLAAHPGSHLVQAWHRRTVDYWRTHAERHHYFWFHYLFGELYEADPAFRSDWDATPKISADGPHWFCPYETKLVAPLSAEVRRVVTRGEIPVFKLTHKLPSPGAPAGSVLQWLEARALAGRR